MKSDHLRALTSAHGPYLSVYLDDSRDSAEAAAEVDARRRDIMRQALDAGADEATATAVDQVIQHGPAPVGRRGRAVIAAGGKVLVDVQLSGPPLHSLVRVGEYPYFLPLLDAWRPPYVFAAVDHLGADITAHQGDTTRTEHVEGDGYPVHKPKAAGWHGYGDVGHSAEEAARMNARAVGERLTAVVDETGAEVLFVSAEVRARTETVAVLPERIAARVVALPAGSSGRRMEEDDAEELITAELDRRRDAAMADTDARLRAEIGRGSDLAAEGLPAVCAALRAGDVDTLIVGDLADATVVTGSPRPVVAPDADTLSELGEAPGAVVRADEVLPFVALTVGACVTRSADDIDLVDGVAALLRYPAPGLMDPAGTASGAH